MKFTDKLKSNRKVFHSTAMKKGIHQKLECFGNIERNQARFILKELLVHCSAAGKDKMDILERLYLTVSSGDAVIIDLRAPIEKKSSHDEFWDVGVIYLYHFSSNSFSLKNHYI